ncbi:MAG: YihY/virulence factor BrkB family protein [Actinomycetia bacterium]|nr:YihY/virulence factor BrkB family protein [Actinomycetes bacterium]
MSSIGSAARTSRNAFGRIPGLSAAWQLLVETIRVCLRYRVTGLASEAGFFALLSLPPLILGLFGGLGYLGRWLGENTVEQARSAIETYAQRFLTDDLIATTLIPTVDDVLQGGRADLISVGFLLSLWSGSRALNVFVDTISIMYGQSGVRGIVPQRALSFSLYVLALLVGIVTIPLVLAGPSLVAQVLPEQLMWLRWLYWPVVTLLTVASLTTLYHVSTPRRSAWVRDVPGALLTLAIWVLSSFIVRGVIAASIGGASIYGPLSAPIVLLIWLYFLAIAVLIGAGLNAAVRHLYPLRDSISLQERLRSWVLRRPREDEQNEETLEDWLEIPLSEPNGDDIAAPLDPAEEHALSRRARVANGLKQRVRRINGR